MPFCSTSNEKRSPARHSLAAETLAWLVEQDIVMATATDCVLSGVGHAPANYASVVVAPSPLLYRLRTNGMSVITGRTIFYSGGVERMVCPYCAAVITFAFDQPGPDWSNRCAGRETVGRCGPGADPGRAAQAAGRVWT